MKFKEPEFEVMEMLSQDVITTSGLGGGSIGIGPEEDVNDSRH